MIPLGLKIIEPMLPNLTPGEKAQLLQWVARDLGNAFPGIDSSPDVCGGEARIVRTRIPVWLLVRARQLGASEAELLRSYPTLLAEDLANAWAYYRARREEIEKQIADNEGIIVCTFDTDFPALALRIHTEIPETGDLSGRLIRINRPGSFGLITSHSLPAFDFDI